VLKHGLRENLMMGIYILSSWTWNKSTKEWMFIYWRFKFYKFTNMHRKYAAVFLLSVIKLTIGSLYKICIITYFLTPFQRIKSYQIYS